jgi:membrane-bound metal-dependent hydrolase YbcI (DUF457 family)
MLGRQHLALSAATISAVLIPFLGDTSVSVAVLVGGCIGSLIPDIDAEDAAIFHSSVTGMHHSTGKVFNTALGPLLPFFGYSTKYLMYIPAVELYNRLLPSQHQFSSTHRSFTHSIAGITTLTGFTGIYTGIGMLYTGILLPLHLAGFLAGYIAGEALHLLQDSCTKTGVAWGQPFSEIRLKGELITGEDMLKPHLFLIYLILVNIASMYVSHVVGSGFALLYIVAVLGLSWTAFIKIIAKSKTG